MVGLPGFEPGTSCTPSKRASQAAPQPELLLTRLFYRTAAAAIRACARFIAFNARAISTPPAAAFDSAVFGPAQAPPARARTSISFGLLSAIRQNANVIRSALPPTRCSPPVLSFGHRRHCRSIRRCPVRK